MSAMHDLDTNDVEWVNVAGNHWGGGILNSGTLTIAGGVLDGTSAYSYAGGIHKAGPLEVRGTSLTGNSASVGIGVGIRNEAWATLPVSGSRLTGNFASPYGGGDVGSSSSGAVIATTV
jgi:hypothetical protein